MPERSREDEREERIQMEIVVDAYGPEEQAIESAPELANEILASSP